MISPKVLIGHQRPAQSTGPRRSVTSCCCFIRKIKGLPEVFVCQPRARHTPAQSALGGRSSAAETERARHARLSQASFLARCSGGGSARRAAPSGSDNGAMIFKLEQQRVAAMASVTFCATPRGNGFDATVQFKMRASNDRRDDNGSGAEPSWPVQAARGDGPIAFEMTSSGS